MRQYRGLTKDGKWVYGWYCKVIGYHYIIPNDASIVGVKPPDTYGIIGSIEVIPETVGQQTGLKDKNGKEAHKADIIKGIHKTTKEVIIGEVVWDDGAFQWGIQLDVWIMNFECLVSCYNYKIIGDIHQNPKLLEKSHEKTQAKT